MEPRPVVVWLDLAAVKAAASPVGGVGGRALFVLWFPESESVRLSRQIRMPAGRPTVNPANPRFRLPRLLIPAVVLHGFLTGMGICRGLRRDSAEMG